MPQSFICTFAMLAALLSITQGFYIEHETRGDSETHQQIETEQLQKTWNEYLSKPKKEEKVLAIQKQAQKTAMDRLVDILNKEYAKPTVKPTEKPKPKIKKENDFFNKLMNFAQKEVKENSIKKMNRSRRRISVQMSSDLPTDKIDKLLDMFKEVNGVDNVEEEKDDETNYYDEPESLNQHQNDDNDYLYDNIYEGDRGMGVMRRSHNTEFGNFQDLILQAAKNRWQQEKEETKLRTSAF